MTMNEENIREEAGNAAGSANAEVERLKQQISKLTAEKAAESNSSAARPKSLKQLKRSLVIGIVVLVVGVVCGVVVANRLSADTGIEQIKGKSVIPKEIIETFEISALDYSYRNIIFEKNTSERKFLFVKLEDASQMYAVQFDGTIKLGVNGKDIKIDDGQYDGERTILKVTIPKAYIIAHDAPLNDTAEVIYDLADHTEKASIGQYTELFNEKKKEIETEIKAGGLLERAQQSAKTQLESLLNAIPEIHDEYKLVFVLE
jgi:hypothetical protein